MYFCSMEHLVFEEPKNAEMCQFKRKFRFSLNLSKSNYFLSFRDRKMFIRRESKSSKISWFVFQAHFSFFKKLKLEPFKIK